MRLEFIPKGISSCTSPSGTGRVPNILLNDLARVAPAHIARYGSLNAESRTWLKYFANGDVVASDSRRGRVHQVPKGKISNE